MPESTLTAFDRLVLAGIQSGFPLAARPYGEIALGLGSTRDEVHRQVQALRRAGVIRRIGGSFAARPLGYSSTLVAARVDPGCLEAAAARASAFPEVTHNYEREGDYALWFTVIAAGRARLEHILRQVEAVAGVRAIHDLPSRRLFKLQVRFRFDEGDAADSVRPTVPGDGGNEAPVALDEVDRRIICRACGDIDESLTPFAGIAAELQLEEPELLRRLRRYLETGAMRRFGAVIRHRAAGFAENGLSVWDVPEAEVERVGEALASRPEVSHCYERPRFPDWPYNVLGMIHGRDRAECLGVAECISAATGTTDYRVLFSGREFKKTSMVYFARVQ